MRSLSSPFLFLLVVTFSKLSTKITYYFCSIKKREGFFACLFHKRSLKLLGLIRTWRGLRQNLGRDCAEDMALQALSRVGVHRHSRRDSVLGPAVSASILSSSPGPSVDVRCCSRDPPPGLWMLLCISVCMPVISPPLLVGSGAIVAAIVVVVIVIFALVLILLKMYNRYGMTWALKLSGPFSDAKMNGH